MLKDRVLETLKFFDLQDYPLTLLELRDFLLPEKEVLEEILDENFEVKKSPPGLPAKDGLGEILNCLNEGCRQEAEEEKGFYCLAGRKELIHKRWQNYNYGIARERRIRRFSWFLKYIPFVRGVALGGSQALGQQKPGSDIDLFIVTDNNFLWLCRTLVTFYFQIMGVRRHGKKIANRFCLNHYVAGPKELDQLRNLYSGMEYARHRPLVYRQGIREFHQRNFWWMSALFPNFTVDTSPPEAQSKIQQFLERPLSGNFGQKLEQKLKTWQEARIKREPFIIVTSNELSLHPQSKQQQLLASFFAPVSQTP